MSSVEDAVGIAVNPIQAGLDQVGLAAPLYTAGKEAVHALSGGGGGDGIGQANTLNPVTPEEIAAQRANVATGMTNQADFLTAMQAQNGLQNQSNVFNQLQGVANGTGPNPAQAMLNNTTGANVANQAALMAGQRGSSANPALMARQAAQQGANIQQQAAGQGAALQAQQQLGALNQMGGVANQQANQLTNATNAYTNAALQAQQNAQNAQGNFNNAQVGMQSNINNANSAANQQKNAMIGNVLGGLARSAGSALMLAEGGKVPSGPQSSVGKHFAMMAKGGKVPALVSPGEKYLDPKDVQKVAQGANPMKTGETIPGKPKVGGAKNSYANDTVSKTLDEGGIVIPRSVTQSKDADAKAHAFVQAILNKKSK